MAFITFLHETVPLFKMQSSGGASGPKFGLSLLKDHPLCSDFVAAHSYDKYENLICWSTYFRLFKFLENVYLFMDQEKSFSPLHIEQPQNMTMMCCPGQLADKKLGIDHICPISILIIL